MLYKADVRKGTIQALTVPDVPKEPTEADRDSRNVPYIKFGSDNLFPQALIELARNSSVHRGIINNKKIFCTGRGFESQNADFMSWADKVNADGEGLKQVFAKLQLDHIIFGNAYLEIVKDRKGSFVNIYHKDASRFRIAKDKKAALWHPDWSKYNSSKGMMKEFPLYPNFEKQEGNKYLHSLMHIKYYEPGSEIYGIPMYIAGMNSAGIIYKTDKWNLSRLDNSFMTSGILLVDAEGSEEDKKKFEEKFDEKFTGEGNQGKTMKIVKEMNGDETRFINLNSTTEGDWTQLHGQSEGNIITAHNWYRSLAGISDNTGFDTQRILQEYEMARSLVIEDQQAAILDPILIMLLQQRGIRADDVEIIQRPPTSVSGLVDVNSVLKIWEGRQLLGVDFDPDDVTQQSYIKSNGKTANNTTGSN